MLVARAGISLQEIPRALEIPMFSVIVACRSENPPLIGAISACSLLWVDDAAPCHGSALFTHERKVCLCHRHAVPGAARRTLPGRRRACHGGR